MPRKFYLSLVGLALVAASLLWGQRTTDPEARIKGLEARIQTLEDVHDIERMQAVYGYYLDKKLWEDVAAMFTDDARVEIGGRGVYIGKAHVLNLFKNVMGGGRIGLEYGELHNHMQLQGVVDVDPGGKTAKGRWRAFMQVAAQKKSALWAEGPYEIEYAKVNGKWMFRTMHWYPTYYVPYDRGWDKLEAASGGASMSANKEYPPDLPSTGEAKPFPEVSVPPFHYKHPITGK